MDMVEPSSVSNITLIVKAASQAVDDKSVKCTTSWTILQLKHHLINIYPTVYPYALVSAIGIMRVCLFVIKIYLDYNKYTN